MAFSGNRAGPGLMGAVLHAAAVFLLLASAGGAIAAERTVTLEEARRLAIANHERVAIAGEGVAQARADLNRATSRILPNVTVEGSYTRYTEEKGTDSFIIQPRESTSAELRITQPLYSGGREWATRRQARLQIQSRTEGFTGAKEDIVREASYRYYGVLKAEKDVEIKSAALRRAEERLEVAEARLRVGDVTRSAVLRAEAERAGAEAELIRSRNGLENAMALLRRVTGLEGEAFSVIEPEPVPTEERSAAALVETALGERTDYSQRRLEERAAGEGITIARAGFKPSLRLEGLFLWRDQEPATTFFQEESASATIRLTYPIFEGFLRRAELSDARSRLREAELRRLGLRRDIEVQITEAINNISAIEALTESFRRQLAFAEEDYKMVFEQFRFGVATTLDVIDSENTLVTAQSSLANAVYDLELAKMDLRYLTGTLVDERAQ